MLTISASRNFSQRAPIHHFMSLPRAVVPGRIYMVQRRCSERRFFLRPGAVTNQAVWYCLAVALQKTGVALLAAMAMSNHVHVVIHDVHGQLPKFLHLFHLLLARSQNCYLGRWEAFWASEQTSCVELVHDDDVLDKCAYALANPVAADLVETAAEWPGASSWAAMAGVRRLVATRPTHFFSTKMPAAVDLPLHGLASMNMDDFVAAVRARVHAIEATTRRARVQAGRRCLGRKAVLTQSFFARPPSHAPRRNLAPRVACRSKWHRIERLAQNKAWQHAYAAARLAWLAGHSVAFPEGTWALRHLTVSHATAAPRGRPPTSGASPASQRREHHNRGPAH